MGLLKKALKEIRSKISVQIKKGPSCQSTYFSVQHIHQVGQQSQLLVLRH